MIPGFPIHLNKVLKKEGIYLFTVFLMMACSYEEEAAGKMCQCADKLLDTGGEGATSARAFLEKSSQMVENYKAYALCAGEVQKEYQGKVDNEAFEKAMKEKCPKNYNVLKGIEEAQKKN